MDAEIGGALIGAVVTLILCYVGVIFTRAKPANGNGKHCAEHYSLISDMSSLKTDVQWLKARMTDLPREVAETVKHVLES